MQSNKPVPDSNGPTLPKEALRNLIVSVGNKGLPAPQSEYATTGADIDRLLDEFEKTTSGWPCRRLLLYAHGGNISEERATTWASERLGGFLKRGLYPIALVWHTDFQSQLKDLLLDLVSGGRGLGNRLVETFMHVAGSQVWSAIKDDAEAASSSASGAAHQFLTRLQARRQNDGNMELHVLGYSAGGIFQAHLVRLAAMLGLPIKSCVLWSPGCTTTLFKQTYQPLIELGQIERFVLYTLLDYYEQLDTAALNYQGSVLLQVSKALEQVRNTPLLGLERHIEADPELKQLLTNHPSVNWVHAPQDGWSNATMHKDFDDDPETLQSTMDVMLGIR